MIAHADKDMEQMEHSSLLMRLNTGKTILEVNLLVSQKQQDLAIPPLGIYTKDNKQGH